MSELRTDERYIPSGTRAVVWVTKPDEVDLSMSLTMPAGAWRHLMRQLPSDGSAAGQLGMMISAMLGAAVSKVETRYWTTGYGTGVETANETDAPR